MASSQFIGFDIAKNLRESSSAESDRTTLNNLGGGAIANDLLTFYNNLRNTSTLDIGGGDISGNTITKQNAEFVYTNGTRITVDSNIYYIKDSDGKTTFKLSADEDLSSTVSTPPTGTYIRSDAVLFQNLLALAIDRERVVDDISASKMFEELSSLSEEERYKLYTSIITMVDATTSTFPSTIAGYINEIDALMDLYELRKSRSILRDQDFSTAYDSTFSGTIQVVDTGHLNDASLPPTSNPGLFIINPKTGTYARTFSSNENVWTENNANLVADATALTIGELAFTGPGGIDILSKDSAVIVESVTPSTNTDFTHYVDIVIGGEDYSLCMFVDS